MGYKAAELASEWCHANPGWQRICDIGNGAEHLYLQWEELSAKARREWGSDFDEHGAKEAWEEFGKKICKVHNGFIAEDGQFYTTNDFLGLSLNGMMVFKTDVAQTDETEQYDAYTKGAKTNGSCN
ncbi:hypothetical protein [Paenibacillus odorifer]|uniref:hypothetical protein n=1 Tax=Paenibacillus odorifer TaxID=189426 RepID=UPI00096DF3CD|nr:hypothetical protein [Paenibacillus odorifer]OMD10600.1 hypothetical protein BJP50_28205 [Paenibacillus odorifer]